MLDDLTEDILQAEDDLFTALNSETGDDVSFCRQALYEAYDAYKAAVSTVEGK